MKQKPSGDYSHEFLLQENTEKQPAKGAFGSAFWDACLHYNVVLVQAIGLCPIILAATNLKYGIILAGSSFLVLAAMGLLMAWAGEKIPLWLRPVVYTIGAAVLMFGVAYLIDTLYSPEIYAALYLFLPLMAVNTMVPYRVGGFAVGKRPAVALADALGSAAGFGLVICLVSAVRELATKGTIFDLPVKVPTLLPQASLPFVGFLLLGFLAALLQWGRSVYRRIQERRDQ